MSVVVTGTELICQLLQLSCWVIKAITFAGCAVTHVLDARTSILKLPRFLPLNCS